MNTLAALPGFSATFRPSFARTCLYAVLGAALCMAALAATASQAAEPPSSAQAARRYDVPAGALGTALSSFAAQSGILLSADALLTQDKTSAGLRDTLSIAEGFARLLDGTGLWVEERGPANYILRAAATVSTATLLAPVRVTGSADTIADTSYQPPPTTSILRSGASFLETPQVVNIVPAQVLRDQKPRNLDDALGNVSGVTQGNTLAGTQDTIMKRGFGGNRDGSIMHNGMPLVQGRGFNAAAERVEMLKGPASLLYGIMDPGGVVNVVSKRPQLDQRTEVSMMGSTYGRGRFGSGETLDSTGPIGDSGLAYRLVVDNLNEAYWRNFGQTRDTLIAPSLAWYGDETSVVVSYEHRDYHYPFDRGTALDPRTGKPLAIPSTRRLDEPFNNMWGNSDLVQMEVDHRLNEDWKAHFGYSWNRERYDANQLRVNGINTTLGTLTRSNDGTHGADSVDSYMLGYVSGTIRQGSMKHDVQFGIDNEWRRIYRADLLRQATTSVFSYLNPVYGQENPSSTVSTSDSDQTDKLRNTSVFLQDAWHLDDKWILVGGLRYLTYDQVAGRGRPFKANTDLSGNKVLPRAGLTYRWSDDFSLYTSYTESLKPTSTIAPLSSGVVIDSAVAPETAKSWEIGAKLDMAEGLTGTLALFDIHKRNVLVSQYNDATKLTDWRTAGAARSRGVELDMSGQLGRNWNLIGSFAYIDAKTTEDPEYAGNLLWNVAKYTASLAAVYDFGAVAGDSGRLRAGGGAHYVGSRAGDSANSFTLPAYTVFDAFATYDTKLGGRKMRFQLNVKNLFNKVYYPSSANQYFISMGAARQVMLTTSMEF